LFARAVAMVIKLALSRWSSSSRCRDGHQARAVALSRWDCRVRTRRGKTTRTGAVVVVRTLLEVGDWPKPQCAIPRSSLPLPYRRCCPHTHTHRARTSCLRLAAPRHPSSSAPTARLRWIQPSCFALSPTRLRPWASTRRSSAAARAAEAARRTCATNAAPPPVSRSCRPSFVSECTFVSFC
jgi:hypothetical protein